jgi:hypothetical protein
MSDDPNQGLVRQGMATTAGAGTGRPRAGTRPVQPRQTRRAHNTISYHPNDALAHAIVRAWSDDAFKNRLLTFSENMQQRDHERTRAALREVGIVIETMDPVVVTEEQYRAYNEQDNHIVFVLPNPLGALHSMHNAQIAMCITTLGM